MDLLEPQQHCLSNMNKYKTQCQWCTKRYASAVAYSNHPWQVHGTDCVRSNADADSRKCPPSDVSEPDIQQEDMENLIFGVLDSDCDSETATEGSNKEARYLSTDSESHAEGQQHDTENPQHDATYGTPIHEHLFPEQDSGYNVYPPFRNPLDYSLARFFNYAKTYKKKIDQIFEDGIFKGLNPTHHVQFRSAHTLYNLVDAAASGPY